jgi:hypothetical protein
MRATSTWLRMLALALAVGLVGCGASMRRFPMREAMWADADDREFSPRPPSWYSPYIWDGIDNSAFRPLAEAFALELDHEAVNVNALDEVPSSSWFTNRLSRGTLAPEVLAAGSCDDRPPSAVDQGPFGPFVITRGKPDGASRGFFVRDAAGQMYLLKPDGLAQPERASAADAVGAAVFWAAGYFVPCNRVVYIAPDELTLEDDAEVVYTDGRRMPLTQELVDLVLAEAAEGPDGRLRFGLSRFIEGEPISPWTYEGTWDADPNDVVPHQDRRDVRAMFVLSAWLGHIDSRQENTLATWMESEEGSRGHVRHYMLDFSDTLGIIADPPSLARRFGHSGYLDIQFIFEDFVTFGLLNRPWQDAEYGPAGVTLGYFDVDRFDPEQWRPGYPNPAYERMTERDAAWMARMVARFGDAHVHALVARARFSDRLVSEELERILIGRRDRILERWLTRLSPLTDPQVDETSATAHRLCLEDRAVSTGFRHAASRLYQARAWGLDSRRARTADVVPMEDGVCVSVERTAGTRDYVVIDVVARTEGLETTAPLRVHAYEVDGVLRVAGVERLEEEQGPPS